MATAQQPPGLRRLDDAFLYVIFRAHRALPNNTIVQQPSIKVAKDLDVAMELWNFALHKDRTDTNLTVAPRDLSRYEDQPGIRNYLAWCNVRDTRTDEMLRDVWVQKVPYHIVFFGMHDMLRDVGQVTVVFQVQSAIMHAHRGTFWAPFKVHGVWESDEVASREMMLLESRQRQPHGSMWKKRMGMTSRQEVLVAMAVLGV